ncbi:MAG TPA: thioesterase family protein [Gordonia sp. (in: high G+C Gram-positive bacteria)]|uniref:acyl-CoA thioesterase domain-containing protein n=1 Tax=unclassified Gordonia (in: high G+C Gram-positive bacteria) TaxID=2657482 RepID=UPI000F9B0FC7|nr:MULTISPECIES: acyl-CoA thioesterase domain-containing protein [unclassified Gordonia (in: high G+C Gram-positive bacteria)]RUP39181.1 MAG: hypothetical protein EKK60_07535 [Gordonia sp. (in: high G+C Gram-positive bacteria)]HNP56493.1 thioesterase family protein [Gordonia sp. (in: high G+C Gram-positive bacteria)]HRC50654.1 thioesterase family protein [Gordonia sp. (in: high G+C Gram-positive bacteria)]
MANLAFFTEADGWFHPTPVARSMWAKATLTGPATCALAARSAELAGGRDGFRPVRFTIDLFRAAREIPTTTTTTMRRDGQRVRVVQVDVVQRAEPDDEPVTVASATTVFLKESVKPRGERWTRGPSTFNPPDAPDDDYYPRFTAEASTTADGTESPAVPWTRDIGSGQVAGRKSYWCNALPAVAGETPTPFQRAVVSAESTSLMGNWGTEGIALINCDLTVALARLPRSRRVGVDSDFHVEDAGISVSETILYDAEGPIGTAICTAVNNAQSEIDFTVVKPSDRLRQL